MRRDGTSRLSRYILKEIKKEEKGKKEAERRKQYAEKSNMYNNGRKNMEEG